ncbi:hypothetical protein HBB16_18490 [Pseudonocardia sp. MCCB 268]|nr:hypothetical protein [Pseudonocardia cytotoxica]
MGHAPSLPLLERSCRHRCRWSPAPPVRDPVRVPARLFRAMSSVGSATRDPRTHRVPAGQVPGPAQPRRAAAQPDDTAVSLDGLSRAARPLELLSLSPAEELVRPHRGAAPAGVAGSGHPWFAGGDGRAAHRPARAGIDRVSQGDRREP